MELMEAVIALVAIFVVYMFWSDRQQYALKAEEAQRNHELRLEQERLKQKDEERKELDMKQQFQLEKQREASKTELEKKEMTLNKELRAEEEKTKQKAEEVKAEEVRMKHEKDKMKVALVSQMVQYNDNEQARSADLRKTALNKPKRIESKGFFTTTITEEHNTEVLEALKDTNTNLKITGFLEN